MRRAVKSFDTFINENYYTSNNTILEANSSSVIKEFANTKFDKIEDVQYFLKKYGTKVVDGKGGSKELKVTAKTDQDTICAFWAFMYGTKSMIPKGKKYPERKTESQLLQKVGLGQNQKNLAGWTMRKKIYEFIKGKNGAKPIPPYPAPKSIIGTKSYYVYRNDDFKKRTGKTSPDYYMNYGNKYCKAFSEKTRPSLTTQGKTWLDKTLVALQEAIEKKLKADPKIEMDSPKFRKYAFDSHPDCYLKSGLLKLPVDDLVKIGFTPEFKEFFNLETWVQIIEIIKKFKPSDAVEIAKSTMNRVWDKTKGEFVSSKKTVAKALTNWYEDAKATGKKVTKKTQDFINWLTECEEQARLEGYPSLNS
jgi:hypothetical protein